MSTSNAPRAHTAGEIKKLFLAEIHAKNEHCIANPEGRDAAELCRSVVFGVLTVLDGVAGTPQFILTPQPHPGDKQDCIENEQNYYDPSVGIRTGDLHDLYSDMTMKLFT